MRGDKEKGKVEKELEGGDGSEKERGYGAVKRREWKG